ncbi:hypothetical protein TSUD_425530, partial [Trifolium subterraneum]
KWVWRILEENESLWCRVLQAKYGQEGGRVSFMEGVGSNWWRALNQVRSGTGFLDNRWLVENIVRRVGDGSQTLFWKDPWLDDCPFDREWVAVEKRTEGVGGGTAEGVCGSII